MSETALPRATLSLAVRSDFSFFANAARRKAGTSLPPNREMTPRTTTLASPAKAEAHLANATASWNHHAAERVGSDNLDNGFTLFGREQPLGINEILWRFDDRMHPANATALP